MNRVFVYSFDCCGVHNLVHVLVVFMFWEWFRKHICWIIFTVYLEYLSMVCCELFSCI
eukprot:Pgem_evm2s2732